LAVFLYNKLSLTAKVNKSILIQAFFNNSIDTIESFHHHTGTSAFSDTSKSILLYLAHQALTKLNNPSGEILFVYKNSQSQLI